MKAPQAATAPRRRFWALLTALLTLAALPGCKLGNADPEPVAETRIEAEGGLLVVDRGPLAGFRLFVPSAAIEDPLDVAVFLDTITPTEAYRPISGVARIEPGGRQFSGAAQPIAVLPLVELLVPAKAVPGDIRVLLREPGKNELTVLVPSDVNFTTAEVRVPLPAFGSVWAVSVVGEQLLPLQDYLPLAHQNQWLFESGVTARVTSRDDVPNLNGTRVQELRIDFGGALDLAFYLDWDAATGDLLEYGLGSESVDRQDIRVTPYRWLTALGGVGTLVPSATTYQIHTPFGSSAVSDQGNLISGVELVEIEAVATPIGVFPRALRLTVEQSWTPQNSMQEVLVMDLWLVEGIGPVQIQLGGEAGLPPVGILGATTLSTGG